MSPSISAIIREMIEFLGRHPFATGLLAILGILGFVLSVIGFGLDRSESLQTAQKVEEVRSQVGMVVETLESRCSSPPCWSHDDLMSFERIGTPKDLIDRKLPPADKIINGEYVYDLDGCAVRIGYRDGALSFAMARLYRYQQNSDGTYSRISCPVDVPSIIPPRNRFSDFPSDPKNIRLKDVLVSPRQEVRLSVACIDCGNAADPFLEFYTPGKPVIAYVDFYFTVNYFGDPDEIDGYEAWKAMANLYRIGELTGTDDPLQAIWYCNLNVHRTLGPIEDYYLEYAGFGQGPRTWTGPTSRSCERSRQ